MIQWSLRHCQQHLSVSTIKRLIFPPSPHPAVAQAKGPGVSLTPLLSAPSGLWGSFLATDWWFTFHPLYCCLVDGNASSL